MKELQNKVAAFRDARDWKKYHTPKNLALAIAGEAGELCDLYRWLDPDDTLSEEWKAMKEVGDIAVFLLSLCDVQKWDLEKIIEATIRVNETNYPVAESKGNAKKRKEGVEI